MKRPGLVPGHFYWAAVQLTNSPTPRVEDGARAKRGRVRGTVSEIKRRPLTQLELRFRSALATLSHKGRGKERMPRPIRIRPYCPPLLLFPSTLPSACLSASGCGMAMTL